MNREALQRIVPNDFKLRAATQSVARACAAVMLAKREPAIKIVERYWESDEAAAWLTRSAVSPASTSTASSLTGTRVGKFLLATAPQSAAARLFDKAGVQLDFAGVATYAVPWPSAVPATPFVAEGSPMPIVGATMTTTTVGPAKQLRIGSAVTNELIEYSAENAATIIGAILSDQASRNLDAAVFSSAAADATRPAGLLVGATSITADAGGSMAKDISALVSSIATAGGHPDTILFVAGASAASVLRLMAGPNWNYLIFGTNQVAAKTVIAVDYSSIATGFSGLPVIEQSKYATAHFEDTTPLPIAQPGPILATPTRSAWQQDITLLRIRLQCAWASLRPGTIAYVNTVGWA